MRKRISLIIIVIVIMLFNSSAYALDRTYSYKRYDLEVTLPVEYVESLGANNTITFMNEDYSAVQLSIQDFQKECDEPKPDRQVLNSNNDEIYDIIGMVIGNKSDFVNSILGEENVFVSSYNVADIYINGYKTKHAKLDIELIDYKLEQVIDYYMFAYNGYFYAIKTTVNKEKYSSNNNEMKNIIDSVSIINSANEKTTATSNSSEQMNTSISTASYRPSLDHRILGWISLLTIIFIIRGIVYLVKKSFNNDNKK